MIWWYQWYDDINGIWCALMIYHCIMYFISFNRIGLTFCLPIQMIWGWSNHGVDPSSKMHKEVMQMPDAFLSEKPARRNRWLQILPWTPGEECEFPCKTMEFLPDLREKMWRLRNRGFWVHLIFKQTHAIFGMFRMFFHATFRCPSVWKGERPTKTLGFLRHPLVN